MANKDSNSFADIMETIRKQFQVMADANPDNGFLKALMTIIGAFTSFLGSLDDNRDAPSFEAEADDVDDNKDTVDAAKKEYEGWRKADEAKKYQPATDSTKYWKQETIKVSMNELAQMKLDEEKKNGGQKIEAISPLHGVLGTDYRISSPFGHRDADETSGIGSTEHAGIDFAPLPKGAHVPIRSTMPGIVVRTGLVDGYGNMVEVMDIYGEIHRYGHMSEIDVKVGQHIAQGADMGLMGMTGHATGVHLHYEQRQTDPNNPNLNRAVNPQLAYDHSADPAPTLASALPASAAALSPIKVNQVLGAVKTFSPIQAQAEHKPLFDISGLQAAYESTKHGLGDLMTGKVKLSPLIFH